MLRFVIALGTKMNVSRHGTVDAAPPISREFLAAIGGLDGMVSGKCMDATMGDTFARA